MNVEQLIMTYKSNNVDQFILQSVEQLARVHGIDFMDIEGFHTLSDENKCVYKGFIVEFFNAWGLETRSTIVPRKIQYVKEAWCDIKKVDDEGITSINVVKEIHTAIDAQGNEIEILYYKYNDDLMRHGLNLVEKQTYYLKFEYEMRGEMNWLHIGSDGSWW